MFESKYSKVLTVILVIVIIAILGLLGFLGYDWYKKYFLENDALSFVENYTDDAKDDTNNTTDDSNATNPIDSIDKANTTSGSSGNSMPTYKGFNVVGTIQIPTTKIEYPILEKVSKSSLETSVAMLYGAGINQAGNTVIIGHNYRNGLFFSNNKKLNNGDKIYITDLNGNKVEYKVYNTQIIEANENSIYNKDTDGKREITLYSCTDDLAGRFIVEARAD